MRASLKKGLWTKDVSFGIHRKRSLSLQNGNRQDAPFSEGIHWHTATVCAHSIFSWSPPSPQSKANVAEVRFPHDLRRWSKIGHPSLSSFLPLETDNKVAAKKKHVRLHLVAARNHLPVALESWRQSMETLASTCVCVSSSTWCC